MLHLTATKGLQYITSCICNSNNFSRVVFFQPLHINGRLITQPIHIVLWLNLTLTVLEGVGLYSQLGHKISHKDIAKKHIVFQICEITYKCTPGSKSYYYQV